MRTRFWISSFSAHCFSLTSRTFSSLPYASSFLTSPTRSGNTPKLSRPTTPRPPTASALAESPSVMISVVSPECFVPALFASSSFGMSSNYASRPRAAPTRLAFTPLLFFRNCVSRTRMLRATRSSSPLRSSLDRNDDDSDGVDPKSYS